MNSDDFLDWLRLTVGAETGAAHGKVAAASSDALGGPASPVSRDGPASLAAPVSRGLAIACSGGLDSRFLCHMVQQAGLPLLLLHAQGPHIPPGESLWMQDWARQRGLELRLLPFDPLALPGVADNSPQRCYFCKQALMRCLRDSLAAPDSRKRTWILCDGTNADDLHAHRPGLRALQEAHILSPLAACGISKERVRHWARETGLEQADQQARPCLLTRLAYGMRPTPQLLQSLAACETALSQAGLPDLRLRLTPAPVLQSLPLNEEQRSNARRLLEQHHFGHATMVEEQALSGYFDRPQ